jgi:hypothetical protein
MDNLLDSGVPYPVPDLHNNPAIYLTHGLKLSTYDPLKVLRAAAFSGLIIKSYGSFDSLDSYISRVTKKLSRILP